MTFALKTKAIGKTRSICSCFCGNCFPHKKRKFIANGTKVYLISVLNPHLTSVLCITKPILNMKRLFVFLIRFLSLFAFSASAVPRSVVGDGTEIHSVDHVQGVQVEQVVIGTTDLLFDLDSLIRELSINSNAEQFITLPPTEAVTNADLKVGWSNAQLAILPFTTLQRTSWQIVS